MDVCEAFRQAEQRVFEDFGLSVTARFLELTDAALRTRVLEAGDGPPVLLVHGGADFASQWVSADRESLMLAFACGRSAGMRHDRAL